MGLKTKNELTKLSLKESIWFKMMMSSARENILKGKEENRFIIVFITYLFIYLLKCQVYTLVGCRIKFHIQWVSTLDISK